MQQKDANATEQLPDDDCQVHECQDPEWLVRLKQRANRVLGSRIFWACYAVLFLSLIGGCFYLVLQIPLA